MEILLVDDVLDIRQLLTLQLEDCGYHVRTAADGEEALRVLDDHTGIRFIISDWMMPVMDGVELCREVRRRQYPYYIFFVLLSARNDQQSIISGLGQGADDYLPKPIDVDELHARLQTGIRILALEDDLNKKNLELTTAISTVKNDLEAAAKIQESLLPEHKNIKNADIDWIFKPCYLIGGDMIGCNIVNDDYLEFYQLDVAGHGIPSALMSFTVSHYLSDERISLLDNGELKPVATLMQELNTKFQSNAQSMMYFTMAYGRLQLSTGRVELVQGGHPEPLWLDFENKKAKIIGDGGFPIGMLPDVEYESLELFMQPNDQIIFYSDGVTECEGALGEQFSEERLYHLVEEQGYLSPEHCVKSIKSAIEQWSPTEKYSDDVSALSVCWKGVT